MKIAAMTLMIALANAPSATAAPAATYPITAIVALERLRAAYPRLNWTRATAGQGEFSACTTTIGPEVAVRVCVGAGGRVSSASIMSRHAAGVGSLETAVRAMAAVVAPDAPPQGLTGAVRQARSAAARGDRARLCPGGGRCFAAVPLARGWIVSASAGS